MGTEPMFKLILSMSLPAMFSMLVQSLYNVVDSVFVAQLGQNAMTAVSLAFPVQMLMMSFAVGTGIGINSLVSRRLGEKKQDEADAAASNGLVMCIATSLLFAVLAAIFTKPFIGLFTQTPEVLQWGCDYTYIVMIFSMGVFVEISLEKTLQATGNMFYPMLFQLVGAVSNIILDPILIFGWLGLPAMGVAGAAIATVLGQILGMLFSTYVVIRKDHAVQISLRHFRFNFPIIREIYRVGFPSIIMQAMGSLVGSIVNFVLSGFSEAAIAVLGGYNKLQSFVFMPVFGLTHGLMPIMGYNYGARKKERIYSALRIGFLIALGIMAVGTLLFELFPQLLLGVFNPSEEMLEIGIPAFRIIALCFLPAAIGIVSSTMFQAVGLGMRSLCMSVLRQLVIIVPAAYLLSKIGLSYVWFAWPLAEFISLAVALVLLVDVLRRYIKPLAPLE